MYLKINNFFSDFIIWYYHMRTNNLGKDALDKDIEIQVLAYVRGNPIVSIRHARFEVGISHNVYNIILI